MALYTKEDKRVPPPPELDWTFPNREDIGKTRYEWLSDEIQSQLPTDILQVTVNEHEFNSCYSYMKQVKRSYYSSLGMVDFGKFGDGNVKVALIRCEMGPMKAFAYVTKAAEILNPKVALFVGLCGTLNPGKAKLGDVVISAKLVTYDDKKIRADGAEEWRGIKTNVSGNMSRVILAAGDGWVPPLKEPSKGKDIKVHCQAVMLSGSELVNNLKRREQLHKQHQEAIAIEMEGKGLYGAAYDLGIEWAVIKGVSDQADGSKSSTEDWQPFASTMAASLVYNMFKYPDVLQQWPNYQKLGQAQKVTPKVSNQPDPLELFLKSIAGSHEGEEVYKGRKIKYAAKGKWWKERWVFDVHALDVEKNFFVWKRCCDNADETINDAIRELIEILKKNKLIQG